MQKIIANADDRNRIVKQLCSLIKKSNTFFLAGHLKPDGDTVGSELAVASLLDRMGKSVDIYNTETVPVSLSFLPGSERVKTARKVSKNYDVAMIFECVDSDRMGNIINLKTQAKQVVNIDHHIKYTFFGHINMINPTASSNSEQLYYLFEELKLPLTLNEATSLYVGMITDTGRFQYSNTNAETMRIAAKLVECGIPVSEICEKIFGTRTYPALKLLGFSLSGLELVEEGKIAFIKINKDDFKRTRSSSEDTEEIVNYGLMIPGTLISILFYESAHNGSVKCSFRSRKNVDVCKLAEKFGGGGHKYASGCYLKGKMDQISNDVLTAAKSLIR